LTETSTFADKTSLSEMSSPKRHRPKRPRPKRPVIIFLAIRVRAIRDIASNLVERRLLAHCQLRHSHSTSRDSRLGYGM